MAELDVENHVKYILEVNDGFESFVMEYMRLNGVYWGLATLDILENLHTVDQKEIVTWILKCQHNSGGFGGNIGHDPHIHYTLSAIQVLALFDKLNVLDIDKVNTLCGFKVIDISDIPLYVELDHNPDVTGLQNEDGSFSGDMWGEVDTRFSYIAICRLSLLHQMDKINVDKSVKYIASCKNHDGGFGCTPGESHAGQIFCCVGALTVTGSSHHIDKDFLGWWLCKRQVKSGGLNGRPEKLPNDKEKGGISDRPDDAVDVFHTYFGVAGLSLLEYPGLKPIGPAYALPVDVVNRIFFA